MDGIFDSDSCTYCTKLLSDLYFKCSSCNNVNLCYFCFAHGVESGRHERTHPYIITFDKSKEDVITPVKKDNYWDPGEVLILVSALEEFAIGNWEDIANKVGTRSPEECRHFYTKKFLPFITDIGFANFTKTLNSSTIDDSSNEVPSELSPDSKRVLIPVNLPEEDQRSLGFMPLRDDFERDYDNDAESLLARVGFSLTNHSEDDELEKALRVAHVGIYGHRLFERFKRKRIAREHGLISHMMAQVLNKRLRKNPSITTPATNQASKITLLNSGSQLRKLGTRDANPATLTRNRRTSVTLIGGGLFDLSTGHRNMKKEKTPILTAEQEHLATFYASYNCFAINDHLKPFMRYFNGFSGKQFLDNLHREEILKHEVFYLMNYRKKGKTEFTDRRPRIPQFKSSVYVPITKKDNDLDEVTEIFSTGVKATNRCKNVVSKASQIVKKARKHYRCHTGLQSRHKSKKSQLKESQLEPSAENFLFANAMDVANKKQRRSRLKILIDGNPVVAASPKRRRLIKDNPRRGRPKLSR